MKSRKLFVFGSVILTVIFLACLWVDNSPALAAGEVHKLRIQSGYPRGDISMELLKNFAESAEKRSKGQLKISVFAAPEIVPWEQLFEATQKGTLEMLHSIAAIWAGILPVAEVEFGLPYAYNIPGDKDIVQSGASVRSFFLDTGFADLLRAEYAKHGLYWLDMHSYGKIITLASKPIRNCDEIKGKKIRCEGSWQKYYDMVGARGTWIPGEESYMGLKLGTIDASQWDVSAFALKWHEVAPYWVIGGQNDVVPGNILINMKSWNALPDESKAALKGAAEEYYHTLLEEYVKMMKDADQLVKEGKVIRSVLDDDCERKHAEAAYKLWDEIGAQDAVAAKAIQMQKEWRKTLK
ncbi:MAG: hypothetical protein GTO12_27165 [Proteobacteria bacterium]|nr:hypothetical protein [Pseudomonadota bacterium]